LSQPRVAEGRIPSSASHESEPEIAMSELLNPTVSVLLGVVPLYAVNRITLNEQYSPPQVGDKNQSQSTSKIIRTVQIEAVLIGDGRQATRLGLEQMADLSKTLPLASSLLSGIPMVAGLTTLLDMQVESLVFGQSAEEKDVYTVSISLKHCPRPGLMAALSSVTNAAGAIVGTARLSSSTPRRA
jgi:hypothetical protein